MEELEVKCSICEHEYSDDRTPRNLPCGHSVCTLCVAQVLARDRKCPECRAHITASTSDDLPVSYTLLRVARALKKIQKYDRFSVNQEGHQTDAGRCAEHGSRLFFRCHKCNVWVCEFCLMADHPEPPKGECKITSFSKALPEMKKNSISNILSEIDEVSKLKFTVCKKRTCLLIREGDHKTKIKKLSDEMKEFTGKTIEINGLMRKVESLPVLLTKAKSSVDKAETFHDITSATRAATECIKSVNLQIEEVKNLLNDSPPRKVAKLQNSKLDGVKSKVFSEGYTSKKRYGCSNPRYSFAAGKRVFGGASTFGLDNASNTSGPFSSPSTTGIATTSNTKALFVSANTTVIGNTSNTKALFVSASTSGTDNTSNNTKTLFVSASTSGLSSTSNAKALFTSPSTSGNTINTKALLGSPSIFDIDNTINTESCLGSPSTSGLGNTSKAKALFTSPSTSELGNTSNTLESFGKASTSGIDNKVNS